MEHVFYCCIFVVCHEFPHMSCYCFVSIMLCWINDTREWRQAGGHQTGVLSTGQGLHDSVPSPTVSASRKKQKIAPSVPSRSFAGPSPPFHPQTVTAPHQPSSSAAKRGSVPGSKGKKHKPVSSFYKCSLFYICSLSLGLKRLVFCSFVCRVKYYLVSLRWSSILPLDQVEGLKCLIELSLVSMQREHHLTHWLVGECGQDGLTIITFMKLLSQTTIQLMYSQTWIRNLFSINMLLKWSLLFLTFLGTP